MNRRRWLKGGVWMAAGTWCTGAVLAQDSLKSQPGRSANNLKLSLNAYSFNALLTKGEMSLDELLGFCAGQGFQGLDLTAYYFPGYPDVPEDAFLYEVKRKAHRLGLHISGTGVRNDFTHSDKSKRDKDIQLVKNWIVAAAKLGAPVLRIFSGTQPVAEEEWGKVADWMIDDIKSCVAFGAQHGVLVALQNHNDFIKTADQVNFVVEAVDSKWFGLVLDIGSYSQKEPYEEIARNINHAVSWQIKEKVNHFGKEEDVDLEKLMRIIKNSGYHGYLPVETLGAGDPYEKVKLFLSRIRDTMKYHGMF
ncbi:sugar phosphate isomerase/epimerase family protein [Negadavirga shengliensis]|uniref:Sugar phosphate isomerase/epimerase family protein n=1 Tax=Negadavirga shengliensis TaxID=1389218 RepID=A0ABV9T7Q3_9BACT